MSDEDDYLSDKFLKDSTSGPSAAVSKTYTDRRKEALRRGALRNEQHRMKSRDEREREAREEALGRSLFDRAQEEARENGQQNKALAMMMKMGFKPGHALGRDDEEQQDSRSAEASVSVHLEKDLDKDRRDGGADVEAEVRVSPLEQEEAESVRAGIGARPAHDALEISLKEGPSHRTVPLALNEWQGKKGIGLGKRAASPSAQERLAKMARMVEERGTHVSFRDRARQEYEERRAAGRLHPAQRTCSTLDEKAGVQFNVLWLNPDSPETLPNGLLDALDDPTLVTSIQRQHADRSVEGRLRAKMQADALRPLGASLEDVDGDDEAEKTELRKSPYSKEELEETLQFLRLGAQDRLTLVLDYLRRKYSYCFWCGTQYHDPEDMANNCPGEDEDAHD